MSKAAHLSVAVSLAAILTGLPLFAMAQEPPHQPPPKKPPVQGQSNHPPGPQGQGQHPGPGQGPHPGPAQGAQFHPPGAPGAAGLPRGPGQAAQFHGAGPGGPGRAAHSIGERGYSFRGGGGRRDMASFNERERTVWVGGRWRHERRFGRLGYWWEVNGAWYYYDQPFDGPPAFVSEVEFMDEGLDPGGPVMIGAPEPVMVAPPVIYAPRPVYVPPPPPILCVGPLCVR